MKRALITGVAGQDGSYMADLLMEKGYEVYGVLRKSTEPEMLWRIKHLIGKPNFHFTQGDVTDCSLVHGLVRDILPDEIYHFAAQSFVGRSWREPRMTLEQNVFGTLNIVEAARLYAPKARILQASSSEMFGRSVPPQSERTTFHPASPYAVSKVAAHHLAVNYRESYGMFVCCSIAFNHESPRRGAEFVTRKIVNAFAQTAVFGGDQEIMLGNMDARRDWGHAKDYVRAMWMMIQRDAPKDYVIGSGKSYSVKEFIDLCWRNCDIKQDHKRTLNFRSDPLLMRPLDDFELLADPSMIKNDLGWSPGYDINGLINEMFNEEILRLKTTGKN